MKTRERIEIWIHDQAELCLKDYRDRIEPDVAVNLLSVIRGRIAGAFFLGAFAFGKSHGNFDLDENQGPPIGFSSSLD